MVRKVTSEGKNFKIYDDGCIRIDNARLLFGNLIKPYKKLETDTPKYGFLVMIGKDTHSDAKDAINAHIDAIAKSKEVRIPSDKRYIKDGDQHEKDTAIGNWTISASDPNKKVKCRSKAGDLYEDNEEINEVFYSGCYVNVMFKPWFQNNVHGKRVNAGSIAIQFVKDGERISSYDVDDSDAWDNIEGDADL